MAARVLVVDDLLPNRRLLEAKLKSEYYEVDTAENGIEALEQVKKNPPDIILLDVMMPEMDGFETCRLLKENQETAFIPVVMVTALSDVQDRVQGLSVGADDFLTKPINDMALFARIRSLVRLKNMFDELRLRGRTGTAFGIADEGVGSVDTSNATIMVVDEDAIEAQRMMEQLRERGMTVEAFDDPLEAVRRSEEFDFDLIMVSSQITKDDALHLCMHFRSQEATKHTPLLLMIEEDNDELLVKAFDMGVNDYMVSPVDANEMMARVNTQVRRKRYQDALKASREESLTLSIVDGLTGVYNRRYFDIHIENMMTHAKDKHKPLALLLLDIDHFKIINDKYGHLSGDEILKQIAPRMTQSVRATDLVSRYGGEEFCIIMPDTPLKYAKEVAMRIKQAITSKPFKIPAGTGALKLTVSMGLTMMVPDDSKADIIQRADEGLYMVKQHGRNNIAVNVLKS